MTPRVADAAAHKATSPACTHACGSPSCAGSVTAEPQTRERKFSYRRKVRSMRRPAASFRTRRMIRRQTSRLAVRSETRRCKDSRNAGDGRHHGVLQSRCVSPHEFGIRTPTTPSTRAPYGLRSILDARAAFVPHRLRPHQTCVATVRLPAADSSTHLFPANQNWRSIPSRMHGCISSVPGSTTGAS